MIFYWIQLKKKIPIISPLGEKIIKHNINGDTPAMAVAKSLKSEDYCDDKCRWCFRQRKTD